MRLLNIHTQTLHSFLDQAKIPQYAILSHTWSPTTEEEVSYFDYTSNLKPHSSGMRKIQRTCQITRNFGLEWVWIDTCCIDKRNLAEVSEAINSMWGWYRDSRVCVVILEDVSIQGEGREGLGEQISKCRWISRGWTLQELLAPREVVFYDSELNLLGERGSLSSILSEITGIGTSYLLGEQQVQNASVAQRLSWAAERSTTKAEDIAYCLLGILEVNIPLLYGEGAQAAFLRLQEEVVRTSPDESLFAWNPPRRLWYRGLLAREPKAFAKSGEIVQSRRDISAKPPFRLAGTGVEVDIGLEEFKFWEIVALVTGMKSSYTIWLHCEHSSSDSRRVCIDVDLVGGVSMGETQSNRWERRSDVHFRAATWVQNLGLAEVLGSYTTVFVAHHERHGDFEPPVEGWAFVLRTMLKLVGPGGVLLVLLPLQSSNLTVDFYWRWTLLTTMLLLSWTRRWMFVGLLMLGVMSAQTLVVVVDYLAADDG